MKKFIEINFEQGPDLIQHQIYPVDCIDTVFIDLPGKKKIVFEGNFPGMKRPSLEEHFQTTSACYLRWAQIERILGVEGAICAVPKKEESE